MEDMMNCGLGIADCGLRIARLFRAARYKPCGAVFTYFIERDK